MDAGANECLTIPYKAHELVARVAILIRRRRKDESKRLARRVLQRVIRCLLLGEDLDFPFE